MNRRSLFGRLAAPLSPRTAQRMEHYRVQVEPLEDRKMLSVTNYVDDNWVDTDAGGSLPLSMGDTVVSSADAVNNTITAVYGTNAFGHVTPGSVVGATSLSGGALIHDAIQYGDDNPGNGLTVSLLEGTYTESDIVIDHSIQFKGSGQSGTTNTLIVPDIVSSHTNLQSFGSNTHSGIIIYAPSTTVSNLHLNGSGNSAGVGTLMYHQGITTLYDTQNGGNYNAWHNGSTLPVVQLRGTGDPTGATTKTHPKLMITDVTVENVFYHGITLAAPGGVNYEFNSDLDGTSNAVAKSTVTNVGDAGNQDESRIGILLLNIYGQRRFPGDYSGGNVDTCTVTSAGVGIETNAWGAKVFDHDDQGATNGAFIGNSKVVNAVKEGFHLEFMSDSDSQLSGISVLFPNNFANFSGSNTATGVVFNHCDVLATASTVNGALIGVRVQNTGSSPGIGGAGTIIATNFKLNGPGTASAGSIGILGDNTSAEPQSSVLLSNRIEVSNYATGVVYKQSYDPGSATPTTLVLSLPFVHGNAVGFNIGAGVVVVGNMNTTDPVFDPGTTIAPGFPAGAVDLSDSITNQTTPLSPIPGPGDGTAPTPTGKVAATGTADVIGTGNLTLGSTSTYTPKVIGNTGGQVTLQNFNADYTFSNINVGIDGADPWNYNGGTAYKQQALALLHSPLYTHWGPTTNGGNGYISLGPQTGGEFGATYSNLYNATPINASGYTALQIVAKADPTNAAQEFQVGFIDQDGTTLLYFTTFDQLSTTTMRTITINLQSSAIRLVSGDHTMNMSAITGWIVGGDIGLADMYSSDIFGLIVDDISFVKPLGNDQLHVTGTVNLGSSVLAPVTDITHFTPSINQVFTIIDNDGSTDSVVGTFAGIAEGGTVASGSLTYQVSYHGGDGNDVTIKRVDSSSIIPTGGRQLFYNQSAFDGGNDSLTTSDDSAIATDKTAYIALTGTSASSTALSSFNRGITGVMVDLLGGGTHTSITASDFIFKTGNDNTPSAWATATAPIAVTVRTGAGISASDRVEILWASNTVKNAWLEVEVLNTANTGLAATDVFYWGSRSGDANLNFATNGGDGTAVLTNTTTPALITNPRDINRNAAVNGGDGTAVLTNTGSLLRISLATGAMAPVGGGDGGIGASPAASSAGDSGIASGLSAAPAATLADRVPAWLVDRLRKLDLNSGPIADYFQYLHDEGTPRAKAILTKADRIADALDLDDHFLDSLLGESDE